MDYFAVFSLNRSSRSCRALAMILITFSPAEDEHHKSAPRATQPRPEAKPEREGTSGQGTVLSGDGQRVIQARVRPQGPADAPSPRKEPSSASSYLASASEALCSRDVSASQVSTSRKWCNSEKHGAFGRRADHRRSSHPASGFSARRCSEMSNSAMSGVSPSGAQEKPTRVRRCQQ